jgi:hypothetical protein
MFVWPTFRQTTEEVIKGFEAAWLFYGGVFPVVIPDNMKPIVIEAENTAPRFNESPQVSHEGEGLLDRRVHAGSRAGTTGAFPRADQMIGEAGHCRAQRLRSAFHASLTAAKREAGILVEPEGEVLADEELLQGARQRSGRTTGATRALKQRLGVQRAVGGEQSADGTDHETGTLNAVTLARELSKAW